MSIENVTLLNLIFFLSQLILFMWVADLSVDRFIKWFTKKTMPKIHECEGCGERFSYPLHNHHGYKSCSIDCDDFLDEVFTEMNY